jgi:arylsulfatase A-like enzyme
MKDSRVIGIRTPALFMFLLAFALSPGCRRDMSEPPHATTRIVRPSILLVTLDTTRADAAGPEAALVETPGFNALAARGCRFRQAYATVPQTLPSHASMMTGLYPAGHGVNQNGRFIPVDRSLLAEQLRSAGYRTAAFVSSFVLARRFGLARGFDTYDDEMPAKGAERASSSTTDRAIAFIASHGNAPLFLWVHYYDPHAPYSPPEPFRSRYAGRPYYGEVAAMDEQLARLAHAFERHTKSPVAIVVAGDHGEGLGEHGESRHGNLLYQATMHVPLICIGPGFKPGVVDTPVSTRHVFHTIRYWAGLDPTASLHAPAAEIVLGEAMTPFLEYGWQPQAMAVEGRRKTILAGRTEVYDVVADPSEQHDLSATAEISRSVRAALHDYPLPTLDAPPAASSLTAEERRKLASLGYVSSASRPPVSRDAPRPADMTRLFDTLERANLMRALTDRAAKTTP